MNLPASAVEFLDCIAEAMQMYNNLQCARGPDGSNTLPFVHVYTFLKSVDEASEAEAKVEGARGVKAIVEGHLGCTINEQRDQYSVHVVRDVAPKKVMACVSFRIPIELLPSSFAASARPSTETTTTNHENGNGDSTALKRHRKNDDV